MINKNIKFLQFYVGVLCHLKVVVLHRNLKLYPSCHQTPSLVLARLGCHASHTPSLTRSMASRHNICCVPRFLFCQPTLRANVDKRKSWCTCINIIIIIIIIIIISFLIFVYCYHRLYYHFRWALLLLSLLMLLPRQPLPVPRALLQTTTSVTY